MQIQVRLTFTNQFNHETNIYSHTRYPSFMMELLQKFNFLIIDSPADDKDFVLTEAQKKAVEAERAAIKGNPDYLLDWDNVKNNLKVD